jgi:hypothetical protein
MKAKSTSSLLKNNIVRIALGTAAILLIPLVAMQFTDAVVWDFMDFVVTGMLLFGAGLVFELTTRNIRNKKYKVLIGIALASAVIVIWIELAVGIFD